MKKLKQLITIAKQRLLQREHDINRASHKIRAVYAGCRSRRCGICQLPESEWHRLSCAAAVNKGQTHDTMAA